MTSSVKDILNESFHEHRPSFKSLHFEKGSFSISASNRSIHKILRNAKSGGGGNKKSSFVSSISTDLGFISEDDVDDEKDDDEESLLIESDIIQNLCHPELIMEGDSENETETEATPDAKKTFAELFVLGEEVSGFVRRYNAVVETK